MFLEELKDGVIKVSAVRDLPRPYVGLCGSTGLRAMAPCYVVLANENVEVGDDVICLAVDA